MLHVVTGGSGSGKSEYAEKLIAESALHRRIYVATMMVWDDEGRKRVRRHREMRSGKGFITIEHYTGLCSLELSTCDKQSTGDKLSIGEKMALAAAVREKALPPVSYTHLDVYKRQEPYRQKRLALKLWMTRRYSTL